MTLNNRPIIIHFERYNGSYEEYFNEFVIGNSKFYIYAFELAKYNQLFDIFPRRLDSDCLDLCFMDLQTWIEETILMNPTIENIVKTAWSRTIERMNNRNREKFMEKPDASRNFIQKILDVKKFYWENESKRPLTYSILDTYIKTVGLF